jgi:hypothetical protein
VRLRLVRDGAGRQERHLTAVHEAVDRKSEHRRHQQDHADDRSHSEILLADDLLVGVGRKHVELPADHLRDAEIRDDEREHDEGRADEAVARAGQGHGPEHAPRRSTEGRGDLVEPAVGEGERRHQHQQRVRKRIEHLGQHDADRAVDRMPEQDLPD